VRKELVVRLSTVALSRSRLKLHGIGLGVGEMQGGRQTITNYEKIKTTQ
jgi:hypothetical protein